MTDPRSDRIFKKIFHEHPRALIHLLNSFLPLKDPIEEIEYLPGELLADMDDLLMAIVDVRCRDSAGRHFIVEMQLQKTPLFFRRVLLNACRIYSRQVSKGGLLTEVQPVFTLCLLDHFMFPDSDEWIHHISPTASTMPPESLGEIHFTFVELRKWVKIGNFDKQDIRDAWMMFFTQPERMFEVYTPEEKARLKEMLEAVDAWDLTRYSERDLYIMDKKIDNMLTHQMFAEQYHSEGMEQGFQEGIQKGIKEGIEQGIEQGIQKGIEQGIQQGIQHGVMQGVQRAMIMISYILKHPNEDDAAVAEKFGVDVSEIRFIRASIE